MGKARRESANRRVILSMTPVEEEEQSGGGKLMFLRPSILLSFHLPLLCFGVGDDVDH